MTSHDGHQPPASAEAQLEALLAQTVIELEERHGALKAELADVTARLSRYKRMQGAGKPPAPKTAAKRGRPAGSTAAMRGRVLEALRAMDQPATVAAIAERLGVHQTTVSGALKGLRDDEAVRFAGRGETIGRPVLWATFPEGGE